MFRVRHSDGKRQIHKSEPNIMRGIWLMAAGLGVVGIGEVFGSALASQLGGGLFLIGLFFLVVVSSLVALWRAIRWAWNGGGRHDG